MQAQGRMLHSDWDRYDTRHTVFQPAQLTPLQLERGYWSAYERFYRWSSIWRGAATKPELVGRLRHMAYAGGWKRFEPLWDFVIRARRVTRLLPMLEAVLTGFGRHAPSRQRNTATASWRASEESMAGPGRAHRSGAPA
jgi:hypothetical protein